MSYDHLNNPLKDKLASQFGEQYDVSQQNEFSFMRVETSNGVRMFTDIEIAMSDNPDIVSKVSDLDRKALQMGLISIPKGDSHPEGSPITFGKERDEIADEVKRGINFMDSEEHRLKREKEFEDFNKTVDTSTSSTE